MKVIAFDYRRIVYVVMSISLKAKILALGELYSCRGLTLVANSGMSILGFKQ